MDRHDATRPFYAVWVSALGVALLPAASPAQTPGAQPPGAQTPEVQTSGVQTPEVQLSDQHKAMSKVAVGEAFPRGAFAPPTGEATLGKRATVVAFCFGGPSWMRAQLLHDLPRDVEQAFGEHGVRLATVVDEESLGEWSELHGGDAQAARRGGALVVDATHASADLVGKGKYPRVYVLDRQGKLVWHDLEYSRSTRRELRQTLIGLTAAPAPAP